MHNKDIDPIIQQEVVLDEAYDIASLEEDYPDSNSKKPEDEIRVTDVDYSDLDDVETDL